MTTAVGVEALEWNLVDGAYVGYLEDHPELSDRWLLVQTLATGSSRRALLGAIGIQDGVRVLDMGSGFGPATIELAGMAPVDVVAMDRDASNLAVAVELEARIRQSDWFRSDGSVSWVEGDIYDIPAPAQSFDYVITRLVFQHLHDPVRAAGELFRVLRRGGGICLVDADDGLSITYPECSEAFGRLAFAFGRLQVSRGGDRQVGRKLSTYLAQAGFEILSMLVLPQATHGSSAPSDPARTFALERFRGVRDEIVERQILSADEIDTCLDVFALEQIESQCNIEAHLAVVARRPH